MKIEKIKGLIPAVFTPMNRQGELALEIIPQYVQMLKNRNLSGVFIAGSSGEGMLLSQDERMRLTESWVQHAGNDFRLIIHVGSTSYKESQALAVHAARQGAWAISVMGPAFFQPQRAEELTAYCEKIAKVVPDLPFYYYHIPGRSGVHVSMKDFLMLVRKRIPGFAGLKFSHTDFLELQQCLMVENGKFDILFGFDHLLLSALPFGVEGAIGTTFNFMAGFYYDIMDAFKNGDLEKARYLQFRAVQVVEILLRYGGDGMAASKAIMGLCGLDCGPCRPPVQNLTEKEIRHMEAELKQIGFFDTIVDL